MARAWVSLAALLAFSACGDSESSPKDDAFDPVESGGYDGGQPQARDAAVPSSDPQMPRDAATQTPDAGSMGSEPSDAGAMNPAPSDAGSMGPKDDASTPPAVACGQIEWRAEVSGLHFSSACAGASLVLLPTAKIGGAWVGGVRAGACSVEGGKLSCSAGALGQLRVEVKDDKLRVLLDAASEATVEAIGLEGTLVLPSATGVLSNGFQSWSQSGVLALGNAPDASAVEKALLARGEDEVYRKGTELSYWNTFVGGGPLSFSAGVVTAETFRSYTQVYKEGASLRVRLISGAGEKISAKKQERVAGEWFRVEIGSSLEGMLRRYGEDLPSRRKRKPAAALAGWNSWYDLWDDVREDQIVRAGTTQNADLAKAILGSALPQRTDPTWIVVDDGWQKAWGTWETNDKFPSGLSGLAKSLKDRGLGMGLWFAPLLVDPDTEIAKSHPEWLVKSAVYNHPVHGEMRILDVTQKDAAAHLTSVVRAFVTAGIGLIKADFLFAGTFEGGRSEQVTGMQAYARALDILRKAAGENTLLVAVGAPPLVTFEYADAWRVGNDIAFKPVPVIGLPRPGFSFIANQARQFTSRWSFCVATLCDADPMLLRTLDREQVEVGAWVAAATGGALFLSDDLTKLPQERRSWGLDASRVTLGLGGVPATPESFFPANLPNELVNMKDNLFSAQHDIPSVWRLPNGKRIVFNFKDAATTVMGQSVPPRAVRAIGP